MGPGRFLNEVRLSRTQSDAHGVGRERSPRVKTDDSARRIESHVAAQFHLCAWDDNKGIVSRPNSGKPEADVSSHHNPAATTAWHGGMN